MTEKTELIVAVDAGTTGTRCCIFDKKGNLISSGYNTVPTIYPQHGFVEQDPNKITELTFLSVKEAVESHNVDPKNIIGLCITVQRNSFVPIDKNGKFLSNMITWQDQRGEQAHSWILECLKNADLTLEDFYKINGQPFGSFQCGFKALWLRKFREDIYNETYKLLTPQAFLTHAFGAEGYTEENNNQNFWLVVNADTQKTDEKLCKIFDFDPQKFPESVSPGTEIGVVSEYAAKKSGLISGIPIYTGSGDQNCGVLGAGNYGTSDITSVCMGTAGLCIAYSPSPIRLKKALCQIQKHPAEGYLIEAHSSSCMSSYQWAENIFHNEKDGLLPKHQKMTDSAKSSPTGSNGVIFLPYFQGAACPHYNDSARGAYIGMSLYNTKNDLCRSTMEGICFENRMMLETIQEADLPSAKTLRILGGASNNDFWNQIQADIYGIPVETVTTKESTALGAGIICAVACGLYKNYKEASDNMTHVLKKYIPDERNMKLYDDIYRIWSDCYEDLSNKSFKRIYDYQIK